MRKRGVLDRWYKAVMPLLKTYYGTGGDANVDELHEVIDAGSTVCDTRRKAWYTDRSGLEEPRKTQAIERLRLRVSKMKRRTWPMCPSQEVRRRG
ncbi:MAG: hypothetical protein IPI81_17425, partial [Flavobacteriales bacterium]|nr:hypothetical protein [Flavobacteriales bacterium]